MVKSCFLYFSFLFTGGNFANAQLYNMIIKGGHVIDPKNNINSEMDIAISTFRSWGLQVVTGPHLFGANNQYSGTDEERAFDITGTSNITDQRSFKTRVSVRSMMAL